MPASDGWEGLADSVASLRAADLARLPVAGTPETIPTLPAFLAEIAGQTPLIVEIKSSWSGDLALTRRVADILGAYAGPVAVKSFDPQVVAALRGLVPGAIPRGIVGETGQDDPAYAALTVRRGAASRTCCISRRRGPTSSPGGSTTCPAPRRISPACSAASR